MTVCTIVGTVADDYGLASQVEYRAHPGGRVTWERRCFAVPAASYRHEQPSSIAVTLGHRGEHRGHVVALERGIGGLHAIAEVDADGLDDDRPRYWSPDVLGPESRAGGQLLGLAITDDPASVAARPLLVMPGSVTDLLATATGELAIRLRRARNDRLRRGGQAIHVMELGEPDPASEQRARPFRPPQPNPRALPLEWSAGGYVLSVR